MKCIATLTMNPTIDVAYEAERVVHTHKIRTLDESYSPGGGGINVARMFVRLGGNARCVYLSGGATGVALDGLLDLHQIVRERIAIAGHTRVATTAHDLSSGKEYRFTPPGPAVTESEWRECLDRLAHTQCEILVASGSLPPGVPTDFYGRLSALMDRRRIPFVLDSSGEALRRGIEAGGIWLAKPSIGEFSRLVGVPLESPGEVADAAARFIERGLVEMIAVTMGHRGAVLVRRDGARFLPAIDVEPQSAVGAGDSFLAAMTFRLAAGEDAFEAFRYGMAAGTAAVLSRGTSLAYPPEIDRLFASVPGG